MLLFNEVVATMVREMIVPVLGGLGASITAIVLLYFWVRPKGK